MIEAEAPAIRAEHETLKQRVAALALKYDDEYPDLLQNYTLAMLLYVREDLGRGNTTLDEMILMEARDGLMVNFTSLHRAITATKRDFQSPEQRKDALKREAFWGEAMGWRE